MAPPTEDGRWSSSVVVSKHRKSHLHRLITNFTGRESHTVVVIAHYTPYTQEGISYDDSSPDRLGKYPPLHLLVTGIVENQKVHTSHDLGGFRTFILSGVKRFSLILHKSSSQSCNNSMFRSALDLRVTSPSKMPIIWYRNNACVRASFSWGVFADCCSFSSFRL